jgi:hypothetical protein
MGKQASLLEVFAPFFPLLDGLSVFYPVLPEKRMPMARHSLQVQSAAGFL